MGFTYGDTRVFYSKKKIKIKYRNLSILSIKKLLVYHFFAEMREPTRILKVKALKYRQFNIATVQNRYRS